MRDKTYEALKANIAEDLNKCNAKELDLIYKELKSCLKKFDRDDIFKNSTDFFKKLFKSKKEKCLFFLDDIEDSKGKLTENEKEELRQYFLNISNIHRTFLEDIQALLGAL